MNTEVSSQFNRVEKVLYSAHRFWKLWMWQRFPWQVYDDVNLTTCKANQSLTWTYTAGDERWTMHRIAIQTTRYMLLGQKDRNMRWNWICEQCSPMVNNWYLWTTLQARWWAAWSSWASWRKGRRPSRSWTLPTTSPMLSSSRIINWSHWFQVITFCLSENWLDTLPIPILGGWPTPMACS